MTNQPKTSEPLVSSTIVDFVLFLRAHNSAKCKVNEFCVDQFCRFCKKCGQGHLGVFGVTDNFL
jgi:hypothetical protein